MLEYILSPTNLNAAYRQVKRNKGAGGVDNMEVEFLRDYLVANKVELTASILRGKYRPNPVRRVEIPKENGQKRQLGIPTVVDRVIQQAIIRYSHHLIFTFRPKRNAHQFKCKEYIWLCSRFGLEKFFDARQADRSP